MAAQLEEQQRLQHCLARIQVAMDTLDERLDASADEIRMRQDYMWEARRDMDHLEKIAVRQIVEQTGRSAEALQAQRSRLRKLQRAPYFGRFDFVRHDAGADANADAGADAGGEPAAVPVYVGVHHFRDETAGKTWVVDWRAPIASVFYDHELGPARYLSPGGEVKGQVRLKRQFRITDGRMALMIESGLNVVDDVLQDELGRASDEGMRQIVATIQRDQNAIVRDDETHTLIIQGVAGSGKTSIALHRIAYLLYRFKDSLTADDILIVSPNRVFSDYIGNVLPELGEEPVRQIGMETLAEDLLGQRWRFQSFFEQTSHLLEGRDEGLQERIVAKAPVSFLRDLDRYAAHVEESSFVAAEWRLGRKIVPDWFFAETWHKHRGQPVTERVARVVAGAEQQIGIYYDHDLETAERQALRAAVNGMVRRITVREAYRQFFDWIGHPEWFKPAGGKLEWNDVFPLVHLLTRLEGLDNPYQGVKHLLVDEMQDYTPVQYAVLARLFSCRKTVLGDVGQALSPFGATDAAAIREALTTGTCVRLNKSFRSTWEIMQFALAILPDPDLQPMRRHGEAPQVHVCRRPADMLARLKLEIADFARSSHRSLAVISKTPKQAARLHKALQGQGVEARLLDGSSQGWGSGVLVCTPQLAKGLEFDRVIVADASADNYRGDIDRKMLYVACTRAMHRLTLLAVGTASELLPPVAVSAVAT